MTDCISMQAMRREGLTDVLTNDWHFEQEGFLALFRTLALQDGRSGVSRQEEMAVNARLSGWRQGKALP